MTLKCGFSDVLASDGVSALFNLLGQQKPINKLQLPTYAMLAEIAEMCKHIWRVGAFKIKLLQSIQSCCTNMLAPSPAHPHSLLLSSRSRSMNGYSFSGSLSSSSAPTDFSYMCAFSAGAEVNRFCPPLILFPHATGTLCQKDVKSAALLSPFASPGYGISVLHLTAFKSAWIKLSALVYVH